MVSLMDSKGKCADSKGHYMTLNNPLELSLTDFPWWGLDTDKVKVIIHFLLTKRSPNKVAALIVYAIRSDQDEIENLKQYLASKFGIKDLGGIFPWNRDDIWIKFKFLHTRRRKRIIIVD